MKIKENNFAYIDGAKSLLEIAKRGVEMAIEKDEKEAEKWMNQKIEKLRK